MPVYTKHTYIHTHMHIQHMCSICRSCQSRWVHQFGVLFIHAIPTGCAKPLQVCLCLSVCPSYVCLSLSICLSMSGALSQKPSQVCLCVSVSFYLSMSVCLSVCLYMSVRLCLFVCLSMSVCNCLYMLPESNIFQCGELF